MTRLPARLFVAAAMVLSFVTIAAAETYPTKPVRIIIPFAPGGINDVVGRLLATHLTRALGRPVIAENRVGAGGVVGTELVANAPKDGHTLLVVSIAHAVNPWLYKLTYDQSKSFAPIASIVSSQNVIAVNNDLPVRSLQEFLAAAKRQPGKIRYASGGVGGSLHLAMELFKVTAGIDLLHIPFKGAGPAVIDVMGGHTEAINATISTLAPHIRGGKIRGIGVTGTNRSPVLPEVPTIAEGGVSGYDAGNWIGLAAPAGTPAAIIARLHTEILAMQDSAEFQKVMAADGSDVVRMSPAEFATYMNTEMEKWGRVVKQAGIKAE